MAILRLDFEAFAENRTIVRLRQRLADEGRDFRQARQRGAVILQDVGWGRKIEMVQERLIDRKQLALVIHNEDVVRLAVEDRAREIFRLMLLPIGLPELDDLVSRENQCERGDEQTQRQRPP